MGGRGTEFILVPKFCHKNTVSSRQCYCPIISWWPV